MNYVLYGEERYLLKEALNKIKQEYIQSDDELNVITYYAKQDKARTVLDDAMTVPFFASHKLIIVEQCEFLTAKGGSDWDIEELLSYLREPLESTILILTVYHDKLDTRKKSIKEIQKLCRCMNFGKLDEQRKISILHDLIKQKHIQIKPDAFQLLSIRLPADMEVIHKQLNQLALYGDEITSDIISKMVVKPLEEDVFALVNAIISNQMKQAFLIYQDLEASNHDPIYLLAILATQLRFLYQVRVLIQKGYSQKEIVDYLRAHPYRVKLSMQTVQRYSSDILLKLLAKCAQFDQDMKAGKIDKKLGFELLLLEIRREQL